MGDTMLRFTALSFFQEFQELFRKKKREKEDVFVVGNQPDNLRKDMEVLHTNPWEAPMPGGWQPTGGSAVPSWDRSVLKEEVGIWQKV